MTREGPTTPGTTPAREHEERIRIINRLRRLEGQMRGLQSMIESDEDCESIMTQVMAARSALNRVGLHIIGYSMRSCITATGATSRDEIVDEALAVLLRFVNLPDRWESTQDAI